MVVSNVAITVLEAFPRLFGVKFVTTPFFKINSFVLIIFVAEFFITIIFLVEDSKMTIIFRHEKSVRWNQTNLRQS